MKVSATLRYIFLQHCFVHFSFVASLFLPLVPPLVRFYNFVQLPKDRNIYYNKLLCASIFLKIKIFTILRWIPLNSTTLLDSTKDPEKDESICNVTTHFFATLLRPFLVCCFFISSTCSTSRQILQFCTSPERSKHAIATLRYPR